MRRRVTVLAVSSLLLPVLLAGAAYAAEDTDPPVLTSIVRTSPSAVAVGDAVRVKYSAADASGLDVVAVNYETGGRPVSAITVSTPPDNGEATFTIAAHAPAGTYRATAVFLRDRSSSRLSARYERDGTVQSDTGGGGQHTFDLSTLDVTVTNPNEDRTHVRLDRLERDFSSVLRPGDEVQVGYSAYDANGVTTMFAIFTDDYGRDRLAFSYPRADTTAVGVSRVVVGSDWASGTYRLSRVQMSDSSTERNTATYRRDHTITGDPAPAVTSHSFAFPALDFVVENDSFDVEAPTLESLTRTSPTTVAPGQWSTLSYRATDAGSVRETTFQYYNPVGTPFVLTGDGPRAVTSDGTAGYRVPSDAPAGLYRFAAATVTDVTGNRTTYFSRDDVRRDPAGGSGPTSSDIDFAAADFYVQRDQDSSSAQPTPSPTPNPTDEPTSPSPSPSASPTPIASSSPSPSPVVSSSPSPSPAASTSPPAAELSRIFGADRLGTAIALSRDVWGSQQAQAVVLARWDAFPDALAGTPLAVAKDAPLLLTPPSALNSNIAQEIKRVLPAGRTVYLLGGPAALSPAVADAVTRLGYKVIRLGGADRYATAVTISKQLGAPSRIFETTGLSFQNALISGVAAAGTHGVVVLTADGKMPAATRDYLDAHPEVERIAVGPQAGAADPGATKVAGVNIYDTARLLAQRYFPSPSTTALASGTVFADALAGGAHIGRRGGPLLLSEPTRLPTVIGGYLSTHRGSIDTVSMYGGPAALSATVEDAARANLRQ